jgi:two-component system sensor histidine kinase/response regulator
MSVAQARQRPCLLLVDDTPANIDVLVGLLQADYDLKVANRGATALRICERHEEIDLILLDVMMPEMDGYEVCRRLRANPATHDIPIIFLTARTSVEDIVQGFAAGSNDYVAKPFGPSELTARVATHLTVRAQQREIACQNEELRELLHILSHDVANQFAALSTVIQLIDRFPDKPIDGYLPYVRLAVQNGIGLTRMVRELRSTEEKGLELRPVSLKSAVDDALSIAAERIREKALIITNHVTDAMVMAEPHALAVSVIGNLVSNAIKFTPRGGAIALSTEAGDGELVLVVADAGVGMPASVAEHVFDVAKSRSRKGTDGETGTGFGMPIVKRTITACGGTVTVTSRDIADHPVDHGTEFRVVLKTPRPA